MTSFNDLALIEPLQRALSADSYTQPTPIQEQAIPALLEGRDLLGVAQTGTGKTAAFALPLLQRLAEKGTRPTPRSVRVLVLAPTRELAVQIDQSFARYGRHLRLSHAVILGGVGQVPQVRALARGVDVLVATPGRLMDLMEQGHVRLDRLEAFVLDEADRMFDMGFIHAVRKIAAALPAQRQTLMFSATMPEPVQALAERLLRDPVRVSVTPTTPAAERVQQQVLFVAKADKRLLLVDLLKDPAIERAIVFMRTKHAADRMGDQLHRHGVLADAIHGDKAQNQRQRALSRFRDGRLRVLVATDLAARGIDVTGITHVINYDLPNEPESYVHRIGRTARAGAEGIAISFCDVDEVTQLLAIEKVLGQAVPVGAEHPHHSPQAAAAAASKRGASQRRQEPRRSTRNAPRRRQPSRGGHGSRAVA